MSTENLEILKTVALVAMPFLMTIIGFFARNAFNDLKTESKASSDKLTENFSTVDKELIGIKKDLEYFGKALAAIEDIRKEWLSMKREVNESVVEIKNLKNSLEDVVILKRDQLTMWKRLDELKGKQ